MALLSESFLRKFFDVSVILKAADSVLEIIGGVLLLFLKPDLLNRLVVAVTQHELVEDPRDTIANYIINLSHHFSASSQLFGAVYLLLHGIIKVFLIWGLLRKKFWSYPVSLVVFTAFGAYRLYRYSYSHSLGLLLLTLGDVVVIALTWHEYNYLKQRLSLRGD